MANNPYNNKVVFNGNTLIDLTGDTVAPDKLLLGYTAHDASGKPIVGTAPSGGGGAAISIVDTTDSHGGIIREITAVSLGNDTVAPENLLAGYTAHDATGQAIIGTASGGSATLQTKSVSYTPSETQQTATVTADSGYDGLDEVDVTVGAISSTYVGTGITRRSSSDLTASGATVTVPSGYYSSQETKSVASGTAGTPTATKGTVSNNSVSVTPSVTNTTGYITGSTKTGTAVTVTASELVSGSQTITTNNTYDVTNLASVVVNVAGGGGLTLLATKSLGTLSTTSTSAADTGQSMTVTGFTDYDVLVVDVSVDTVVNGRHTSTVSMIYVTGTSNVGTKNTYAVGSNKWNSKRSSSGTGSTRQSTTAYGVYANSATVSSGTMTIAFYYRQNSNSTGTLNGTYTARVYGLKLYDLIGG